MANNSNNYQPQQGMPTQGMPSANGAPRQMPRPHVPQNAGAGQQVQYVNMAGAAQGSHGAYPPQRPKGGGKRSAVIIAICCVLAAAAVWVLVWLFACNGNSLFDSNAQSGQAPYKTQEEMQAELDRQVEEGMFNISIASVIEFADGSSAGTAYIENVPGNRYNMQVTIVDDATGDMLYESGVLAPNQFIQDITLSKNLEPGTYNATATFKALDKTTYDEVGQAAAKITLNVLG